MIEGKIKALWWMAYLAMAALTMWWMAKVAGCL